MRLHASTLGARTYYLQSQLSASLRGVRVDEVMAPDCAAVDGNTTLRRFVDEQLLRSPARCFAITQNGRTIGLIAPDDVSRVDREQWDYTTVAQSMRPLQALHPVKPDPSRRRP